VTKKIRVQNYNPTTLFIAIEPIGGAYDLLPKGVITIESNKGYDMGEEVEIVPDGSNLMISIGGPQADFHRTLVVKIDGMLAQTK